MTRRSLPLCLLAALSGACTFEQKHFLDLNDHRRDTWLNYRIDPRDLDDKDAELELIAIERRISKGLLPKVQFDFDSDAVLPLSHRTLDVVADWMLRHPDRKIRITAHTCAIGTEEYNLELSERRAKSVKAYLVKQGVPPPSLRYRGAGLAEPLVANDTDRHREINRRVEFRVTKRDWDSIY
jgi:outer membrane protein OmpA-like peptidoglycan-associated protein